MSELHLDADEWATILLAMKMERERESNSAEYNKWIDMIILKIDVATGSDCPMTQSQPRYDLIISEGRFWLDEIVRGVAKRHGPYSSDQTVVNAIRRLKRKWKKAHANGEEIARRTNDTRGITHAARLGDRRRDRPDR